MKAGRLVELDEARCPPSGIRLVFDEGTYRALEPLPDLSSDEGEEDEGRCAEPAKRIPSVPFLDAEAMRTFKTSPDPFGAAVAAEAAGRRLALRIAVAVFVATMAPALYFLVR